MDEPSPASATICLSTLAVLNTSSILSRKGVPLVNATNGSPAKSAGLSRFSRARWCPLGTTATQLIESTGSTWMPGESPDSMANPVSQNPELIQLCTVLALPEWMDTMTSGYSVLKAATMRASRPPASRGMAATLRRLALNERMLAAADSRPARPMKVFSTS
ncbi:hypothetical protein D9M68_748970 [compost metagenome]